MRIPRIFTTQQLSSHSRLLLESGPSHHLVKVLRLGRCDTLILFDGHGGEYTADIVAVDKNQVEVHTDERRDVACESLLCVHLGIAISRSDRMDWVVQKSTELGVGEITPLLTRRTGIKLAGDRADKKLRHWRQIAVSACEQCGRDRVPVLHPPKALEEWLKTTKADKKFVLHPQATHDSKNSDGSPTSVALLAGPEGGLDKEEIAQAETTGYLSLKLGPRILRTETAPLVAITVVQGWWGDI
ncbi:MAG: 16S rRNA (uracil(1498)-N(3))-methyltransferase [Halioglobus sp.]|nr:16S rRNA (uracil(1498)-N(3))-methyltransferase [Halioglobus sp.]